jgi:site-specific recombinase XerD
MAAFLDYQRGCGASETTVKRNGYLLGKFARRLGGLDVRDVTREKILRYREYLATAPSRLTGKPIGAESIGLEMSVLKGFFDYLLTIDKILVHPLEGMRIKARGKQRLRPVFTEEDIALFLDGIPLESASGRRDRALFELMYSSGLRVGDALNLKLDELNLEERVLLVVRGKGKKDAYLPFSEAAATFLATYLAGGRKKLLKRLAKSSRQEAKTFVFVGRKGKLNYARLLKRFHGYLSSVDLSGKGYTMHSIRHAAATHLLAHGASIRYVQELLRHEDLKTTQLYTRPTVDNIKAVYRTYHPRENEFYKEVDERYLAELKELAARLLWGRKVSAQYRKLGHTRGFGAWKRKNAFPRPGEGV